MKVTETIEATRAELARHWQKNARIGLVPTMGALHAGHYSLIDRARADCEIVAVSIFVNPLQFGANEDLDQYPRPREADLAGCEARGVDLVFCPDVEAMYGNQPLTSVHVAGLTEHLCGAHRPGHFDGVCTVVTKLFNIVQPTVAYFGEKDFQQLQVIGRMVSDLALPIEIAGCPLIREPDGLALSSRNADLSATGRTQATAIYQSLSEAVTAVADGVRDISSLEAHVRERILAGGATEVDYVTIVDPQTVSPLKRLDRPARLCVAAHFEGVRLIDNVALDVPPDAD